VHRHYIYIQKDKKTDGDIKVTYGHTMEDKRQEIRDRRQRMEKLKTMIQDIRQRMVDSNQSLDDETPRMNDKRHTGV